MKRFRLDPLVVVRKRRLDAAHNELLAARRVLAEKIEARTAIERRIQENAQERRGVQAGMCSPDNVSALKNAEQRLALLQERADGMHHELEQAQQAIEQAEQAVEQALVAYRQAHRKNEAILEQKQNWKAEELQLVLRAEEQVADELAGRRTTTVR